MFVAKEWLRTTPDLADFFGQRGTNGRAEKIIGLALFYVESSLLNRRITNDCLELLREETERREMKALGLHGEDVAGLFDLIRRNLSALNDIRRHLWKR